MLTYFLQANVYAAFFSLLYLLFLRNKNNYTLSRFYLLGTIVIAMVLPFIKVDLAQDSQAILAAYRVSLPEISLSAVGEKSSMGFADWLLMFYILIAVIMLIRLTMRIIALRTFLTKQEFERKDGYKIAINTEVGPASFGNVILFPKVEIVPEILNHELVHIHSKHHYDKAFMQLALCFAFPIIAIHYIIKELETVHELEADAKAVIDKDKYTRLLLNQHFKTEHFDLLQTFFHHPLKRRIIMLQKSSPLKPIRRALVLASTAVVISGLILMQSTNNVNAQQKKVPPKAAAKASTNEHEIFRSVEIMPEYPGGIAELQKYLATNLKYPEKARKDTLEGRITTQFVVGKDGKVNNVVILRSLSTECDAEVVRVIKAMPAWKPGTQDGKNVNVYYTLPVSFKLK